MECAYGRAHSIWLFFQDHGEMYGTAVVHAVATTYESSFKFWNAGLLMEIACALQYNGVAWIRFVIR